QSVNQNQLDRIHQSSMQNGMMAQPQYSNSQGGYGNFGGQQYNQGYNNSYNQGYQQSVNQNQLDRIHQNSLFGGAEQQQGFGQEQQIQQRSMQSGMMAQPQYNSYQNGFGGGASSMMSGMGGSMSSMGMGGQQGYGGQQYNQGYNNSYNQGYQQSVNQNQLDRIHQNSLYGGAEQQQMGYGYEQQIQQRSMQSGMMAQPQLSNNGGGFGGNFGGNMGGQSYSQNFGGQGYQGQGYQGQGQMMGGGAFAQVMSADQGMTDDAGPSAYPSSMYAGRNQYDTVNQSVFSQMSNMGGQFNR
ncbi:MAG: hypothetical protein ACXVP5_03835, partial [Tumebacillaceae bacterium]